MESKSVYIKWTPGLINGMEEPHESLIPQARRPDVSDASSSAQSIIEFRLSPQRVLENIVDLLQLSFGKIWIVKGGEFILGAQVGCLEEKCQDCIQTHRCFCRQCAETGQVIAREDLSPESSYGDVSCVKAGLRSILAVPLRSQSRMLGVMLMARLRPEAFGLGEQSMVAAICECAAMTLNDAASPRADTLPFEKTLKRYEAMVALHETSLGIIAQLDTGELLDALLRRGALLLDAQACSLFLYDRRSFVIHNVANYNTWSDWTNVTLRLGEGVIGRVILTGKPLIVNDYINWEYKRDVPAGIPSTRKMGAPLRWQNKIIGGVVVTNAMDARPFDEDDLWLLNQFADLASIAVKNAVLYEQTKQATQELEKKVDARTRELSRAKEEIAARSEQLRLLLAKTIRVQEDEQARIARDIHDGVFQLINAARYQLQAVERVRAQELTPAGKDKLLATRELLDEMEDEIRHTIRNMRPPILDAMGLGPAIRDYVTKYQQISGITCHFETRGEAAELSSPSQSSIYRIVQEALSNVAAHAQATEATVILDYQPTILSITVTDNGCGIDERRWQQEAGRNGNHLGLLGMQERAKSLGGGMQVESLPTCGTRLKLWIPISRGEPEWLPSEF